jgi:hypothetical protein
VPGNRNVRSPNGTAIAIEQAAALVRVARSKASTIRHSSTSLDPAITALAEVAD